MLTPRNVVLPAIVLLLTTATACGGRAEVAGDDAGGAPFDASSTQTTVSDAMSPTDAMGAPDASVPDGAVDASWLDTGLTTPTTDASVCVAAIGVGSEYACAALGDGSLWCWGRDDDGELANAVTSTYYSVSPVLVPSFGAVVSMQLGINSACALVTDGSVWCWGENDFGEVGNGVEYQQQNVPVRAIASGVTRLAKGDSQHMCAIESDGSVWCWGSNIEGESGGGQNGDVLTPLRVNGLPESALEVATGWSHTCVLAADTTVWCWGANTFGQLGSPTENMGSAYTPQQVVALGAGVTSIAGGIDQTCAVKADGTVWCWGGNMYGESGPQAGAGGSTTPSQVVSVGGGVLDVTADEHTCVTKSDGSVWCWGECEEGQCGSTLDETAAPAAVVGASNATVIIAGDWNTCILTAAATMECWGDDSSGQLGNGMYTYQPATSPLLVPLTCP